MSNHQEFHFSITCHTDDKPVVYCLRSLAHFAERHRTPNIAWGGTGDEAWQNQGHCITLRFTHPEYRQIFRDIANELLNGRWEERGCRDNDPATPQRGGMSAW